MALQRNSQCSATPTPFAISWFLKHKAYLIGGSAFAILLTVSGPFGTYDALPVFMRLLYWSGVLAGSVLAKIATLALKKQLFDHLGGLAAEALSVVVLTIILTPMVYIFGLIVDPAFPLRAPNLGSLFAKVLVVTAAVASMRITLKLALGSKDRPADPLQITAETPDLPRLYARISDPGSARVLRLSVNDHYVLVHFDDGNVERLLMRFKDAIAEMGEVEGICIHRSHWVTCASIVHVGRKKGRSFVLLVDGIELPVSRTYRHNLEKFESLAPGIVADIGTKSGTLPVKIAKTGLANNVAMAGDATASPPV